MLKGLGVALVVALLGAGFLCASAPWQQVDPRDGSVYQDLGYAPIWSHEFANIPGAQVASDQVALYAIVIFALSVIAGICAYIIFGPPFWRRTPSARR